MHVPLLKCAFRSLSALSVPLPPEQNNKISHRPCLCLWSSPAAAGSPILDLPEPLLLHILGFLTDPRSRHRASLACHRLLAAERATRSALSLRGGPQSPAFLLLGPAFCFPALERLDLSLVSPWGHPFLSAAAPAADAAAPPSTEEEVAQQNAFIVSHLTQCFPAVSSLAVYCRDPTTLSSLTPHWRARLHGVKLLRWHQRPPGLGTGADLEPLLQDCPALRALDLSEFYCWTEDIEPMEFYWVGRRRRGLGDCCGGEDEEDAEGITTRWIDLFPRESGRRSFVDKAKMLEG